MLPLNKRKRAKPTPIEDLLEISQVYRVSRIRRFRALGSYALPIGRAIQWRPLMQRIVVCRHAIRLTSTRYARCGYFLTGSPRRGRLVEMPLLTTKHQGERMS